VKGVTVKKNLWPAIRANLRIAAKSHVAVGFPGDSSKATASHGNGMNNIQVALANEFGSAPGVRPVVPARPFVKETMKRHGAELTDGLQGQLRMIAKGEQTTNRALEGVGKIASDKVKDTIVQSKTWAVPNADFTKAKKRSSTPLIDTGAMRQAVTHKVRMGRPVK